MAAIPTQQTAVKVQGAGQVSLDKTAEIPTLQPDEVLVQVRCVALNPVDWKSTDMSPTPGSTLGCDFAGEIVQLGSSSGSEFKTGDRVCGCVFGNNPDRPSNGAFAEYVAVPAELLLRVPDGMTFQVAASLGVGIATVGLALYHSMGLPLPDASRERDQYALVYGGGTATGALAIQMLRLSGFKPVAVCSPRSFDTVKALGAVAAFDYHSPSCGDDVRAYTNGTLAYALDCITNSDTMKLCYAAIGKKGGKYLAVDPFPIRYHSRRSVQPDWIVAFTIFNRPVNWQRPYKREARPQDREFAATWYQNAQTLIDGGAIVPHALQEQPGGLEGVLASLDKLRKGRVSGVKLVHSL